MDKLPLNSMDMEYLKGADMMELFNSPKWQELYQSCLGCGTCTFVCPTCQCYDIRDYDTGHGIIRYRCWDSCMYPQHQRTGQQWYLDCGEHLSEVEICHYRYCRKERLLLS